MDPGRELRRIALVVVTVAGLIGAAIGWALGQLVTHLHDHGLSDHFRGGQR